MPRIDVVWLPPLRSRPMTRAAIIERIWKKVDGRMAAAIRLEIQVSAIKVILKEFEGYIYIYIIYIYILFFSFCI